MHTTLHLVFKILKWPIAIMALIGLPGIFQSCCTRLLASINSEYLPFWSGVGGMLLLWSLLLRKARWARFITTIEHEALHAIVGFISFIPIRELKVNEDGSGHVIFTPPTNWLMLLAPYFVPLTLAIYAALVFALELEPLLQSVVLGAIFGLEWAGNVREIHPKQTDFRQAGWVFSVLFLPSAILLSYGSAITILLEGGVGPGWTFAKAGVAGMWNDTLNLAIAGIDLFKN
jgi:hypothetical protein